MGVSIKVGGAYVPHQFSLKQGGVYVAGSAAFKAGGVYVGVGAGAAPLVYPLDEAGALPLAAYGVARLSAAYSGPAVRVRRADAVEVDIGFDGQNLDSTALSAHLGTAVGTVTTFYDLTGNGNHAVQTTVSAQADIQADLRMNGIVTVSMVGQSNTGHYVIPAGVTLDRQSSEVIGVAEWWQSTVTAGWFEIGAASNANMGVFALSTPTMRGTPPGSNTAFPAQARPIWMNHVGTSPTATFEQDGEINSGAALGSATASGGFFGRLIPLNAYRGYFHTGFIAFYNRVLSAGERSAAKAASNSIFKCVSSGGVLIYQGDSIAASSTVQTLRNGWTHQVTPLLTGNPRQFNYSGGGQRLDVVLAAYATVPGPTLTRYSTERRVVFVPLGTNDMGVGGRTAAQVYADTQSYCSSVRASGGLVIVSTLLPRTSYGVSNVTEFATFNSNLRANWASFADGFVDFANEPTMGTGAANTSLYVDGLHPTAYGNSLLAAYAAPEINRVFALP
jgi:lysophospholipase L1-like esterase